MFAQFSRQGAAHARLIPRAMVRCRDLVDKANESFCLAAAARPVPQLADWYARLWLWWADAGPTSQARSASSQAPIAPAIATVPEVATLRAASAHRRTLPVC